MVVLATMTARHSGHCVESRVGVHRLEATREGQEWIHGTQDHGDGGASGQVQVTEICSCLRGAQSVLVEPLLSCGCSYWQAGQEDQRVADDRGRLG